MFFLLSSEYSFNLKELPFFFRAAVLLYKTIELKLLNWSLPSLILAWSTADQTLAQCRELLAMVEYST
jgi:hypothetical protein